jgi:hypothetical protein
LFSLLILAPCSTKYFTISSFPFLQALNNGVSPKSFSLSTLAPCSTKYFTIFIFPPIHAKCNGVFPCLFSLLIASSSRSIKYFTIFSFPFSHALNIDSYLARLLSKEVTQITSLLFKNSIPS